MPLYEYECEVCQHRFERIQKVSDPLVETCPVCGGPVHKRMSAPAIQFKGSGFYITDYAKKDQPSTKGEKADTSEKGEKADAAKSDGGEKAGKSDTSDKAAKTDKADTSPKSEKSSATKGEKSNTTS